MTVAGGLLLLSLYMDKRMQRETLGGGDIKLLFLTGLFFGWKGNLLCLVLACVAGIVWGLAGKRRGEADSVGTVHRRRRVDHRSGGTAVYQLVSGSFCLSLFIEKART